MEESESNAGSIIGALIGFACGVGIGLLFAPKPGTELRQDVADLVNKGRRKGRRLVEQGSETISSVKERVTSEGGKEPFYESGKYT